MMKQMMEEYMENIEEQLIIDLFDVPDKWAQEAIAKSNGDMRKIKTYLRRKARRENAQPTKCKLCGKRLTDPESIERGYGSECYKKQNSVGKYVNIFGGDDVK